MHRVTHIRRQHNVGQGGFHSSHIEIESTGGHFRYDYIYDCGAITGTLKSPSLMRQIEAYRPREESRGKFFVDALVLSHFDGDHMNGAEEITRVFNVLQIFLPALAPQHLALELARQATSLTPEQIHDLFEITYGASLWGVPVTRVLRGGEDLPPSDRDVRPDNEPPTRSGSNEEARFPQRLTAVNARTGAPLGHEVDHRDGVELQSPRGSFWRFRFWSQNVSDELAVLVMAALHAVGFPLNALEMAGGEEIVATWIAQNRDDVVDAYRHAYVVFQGKNLRGAANGGFANYLSMTMFSGPTTNATPESADFSIPSAIAMENAYRHHWRYGHRLAEKNHFGWMGTGDAMLGEPGIWKDFASHYHAELDELLTILLPHHGAAPKGGSKFYNAQLSSCCNINVLSYGAKNTYGHPATSVLDQIFKADTLYIGVTEEDKAPFCEVLQYRL